MTRLYSILFAICVVSSVIAPKNASSCSGVFLSDDDSKIVGRTFDWPASSGVVEINARGIKKQADMIRDDSKPVEWLSIYGSIAFNIEEEIKGLGKQAASVCGINEKGLWVASFWVMAPPEVKYPEKDRRPTINNFQLEQYILDNFKSVEEVIKNINRIRISGFSEGDFDVHLHWFIADETGSSAIIEFPNGELKVHHNPRVMTNNFYEGSQEYLKGYEGFGGTKPVPEVDKFEPTSENRYLMASYLLNRAKESKNISMKTAFDIMKKLKQKKKKHSTTSDSITQWVIVYDLKAKQVKWNTRFNPTIRTINLSELDFAPPRHGIDVNSFVFGNIKKRFRNASF